MSLPSRLLGANPSIQVSSLLSGSLTTPSAKGSFIPPTDFESIASFTGSNQSEIIFSSIPQTYQHLQVRMITRMSSSSTTDVLMYVNNDSSANYSMGHYRGSVPSTTAANFANESYLTALQSTGTGSTTGLFGVAIIDIFNYANTTKQKSMFSFYGNCHPNTSNGQIRFQGSLWRSTAAITSLKFFDSNAGNFLSGSRISLYGIAGA
jgi:hypothetical protein